MKAFSTPPITPCALGDQNSACGEREEGGRSAVGRGLVGRDWRWASSHRQRLAADAAVDLVCIRQLARLDDCAVDGVEGGAVGVEARATQRGLEGARLARGHSRVEVGERAGRRAEPKELAAEKWARGVEAAQHGVVLLEEGSRVAAGADDLRAQQRRLLGRLELSILRLHGSDHVGERARATAARAVGK
jgi:hypothetical protein